MTEYIKTGPHRGIMREPVPESVIEPEPEPAPRRGRRRRVEDNLTDITTAGDGDATVAPIEPTFTDPSEGGIRLD